MALIDYSIKDVEKVVNFEGEVKDVEVSRLTAPGENYLSLVLRVDFEVEQNGNSKTISTVAKRLPLHSKKEGFNFHAHAMKNEIKWYSEMLPLIKDFAKENSIKIDFSPEYYGSRYSLDSSKKEADSDSVLLLENLIPQGFQNDDRYIGSDFITSKAILKSLALFHGLIIAIKEKNPELFQVVKDFLDKNHPDFGPDGPDGHKKPPGPPPEASRPEKVLLEELAKIPDLAPYMDKITPLLDKPMNPGSFHRITKEPWNTVSHNDFWVNNIMVNHRDGKEPLVKIVDFQMCSYGSYAKDLVFFLLSSVRNDVTIEHMDDLIRFYYEEFTSILRESNVNLELTYEDYLEEIRTTAAETELCHAIFFSTIIFGEKGTGVDVAVEKFEPEKHLTSMIKKISQKQIEKVLLIATEATKRNWM